EAGREVSLAVEVVAVARKTVLVIDAFPLREVRGERVGALPQGVLQSRQRNRLAPEGDLGGRRGMDRTQVRRRRDGRLDLAVRDQAHQRGHPCDHDGAYYFEPRLDQNGLDRLLEVTPALVVVAHVDEQAER